MNKIRVRTIYVVVAIVTVSFLYIIIRSSMSDYQLKSAVKAWQDFDVELMLEIDEIAIYEPLDYQKYDDRKQAMMHETKAKLWVLSERIEQSSDMKATQLAVDEFIQICGGCIEENKHTNPILSMDVALMMISVVKEQYKISHKTPSHQILATLQSIDSLQLARRAIAVECAERLQFGVNPNNHRLVMSQDHTPFATEDVTMLLEVNSAIYQRIQQTDRIDFLIANDIEKTSWAPFTNGSIANVKGIMHKANRIRYNQRLLLLASSLRQYYLENHEYPQALSMIEGLTQDPEIDDQISYEFHGKSMKLSVVLPNTYMPVTWEWVSN